MAKVILTQLAREDFKGIGRYTQENWGVKKRNSYLGDLDKAVNGLAENHRLDRKRGYIRKGLISYPCNEHMIFFRRDGEGNIEVLRILGQSMDFDRHL